MHSSWHYKKSLFIVFLFTSIARPTPLLQHDLFLCKNGSTKVTRAIEEALRDIGLLFYQMAHWDTFKTAVATFPFFAVSKMIDQPIQDWFYDKKNGKNIHQICSFMSSTADRAIIDTITAVCLSNYIFSHNQRLRETSKMFLLGLPFIVLTTNIIKKCWHNEICCRPLHEDFSKNGIRSYGGFPSTHAAQITYATVLFGTQYGIKAAFPLGAAGACIAIPFVNNNRHYISQIVAGAGLGTIYGLAASRVVSDKFASDVSVNLKLGKGGKPTVKLLYKF